MRIDLVIRSVNNLRLVGHRCGFKLSITMKTAMAETTVLCIAIVN